MIPKDVLKLPIGSHVRSKLNLGNPDLSPWFTGRIASMSEEKIGSEIPAARVIINRDDGRNSTWISYVTKENNKYFELYDPDWDLRDNI